MAKKQILRTRYPLEDNVKRALFIRPGTGDGGTTPPTDFEIPYATREETDAGILTNKVLNPDVGAYAYDRLRHVGRHEAGKATKIVAFSGSGTFELDCRKSNVFRINATGAVTIANPIVALDGQVCNVIIKQDATGGHAFTFGDRILTAGTVDTAANARSILSMQYDAIDDVWCGVISSGFA